MTVSFFLRLGRRGCPPHPFLIATTVLELAAPVVFGFHFGKPCGELRRIILSDNARPRGMPATGAFSVDPLVALIANEELTVTAATPRTVLRLVSHVISPSWWYERSRKVADRAQGRSRPLKLFDNNHLEDKVDNSREVYT